VKYVGSLLILAAGAVVAALAYVAESIRTGNAALDRHRIRIAANALLVFGPRAVTDLRIPRALMAILRNESAGKPAPVVGDASLSGGPSIGPMQVYRSTAIDLKLWTPPAGMTAAQQRAAYAALAMDEGLGIRWGVQVFAEKLRLSGGDIAGAVRRYNGSGSSAEAYRDRALAFAETTWGEVIA
jgi:hypothetical protein